MDNKLACTCPRAQVRCSAIEDLAAVLVGSRNDSSSLASNRALSHAVAALSELALGWILQVHGGGVARWVHAAAQPANEDTVLAIQPDHNQRPQHEEHAPTATGERNRLQRIAEAQVVPQLVMLCESTCSAVQHVAAGCLCHLSVDATNCKLVGAAGGIAPLATLLAHPSHAVQRYASVGLRRLAGGGVVNLQLAAKAGDNQQLVASALIELIDHSEASVVRCSYHTDIIPIQCLCPCVSARAHLFIHTHRLAVWVSSCASSLARLRACPSSLLMLAPFLCSLACSRRAVMRMHATRRLQL